jgi:lysophospholipase L1-like esterase
MGVRTYRFSQKALLVSAVLVLCFVVIEVWLRVFPPSPLHVWSDVRMSTPAVFTEHDVTIGWKGRPNIRAVQTTPAYQTVIEHNSQGFRDIEHGEHDEVNRAIVFLGDSFTWGFEADFEDMFVNRLRQRLSKYTVFNLAQSRYGTDQELLTFQNWHTRNPVELVVVMFYANDIADNNSDERWDYPKPLFQVRDGELVLTNVPVPKPAEHVTHEWQPGLFRTIAGSVLDSAMNSRAINELVWRLAYLRRTWRSRTQPEDSTNTATDMTVTRFTLRELKREAEARGARLAVVAIPHLKEIYEAGGPTPFPENLEAVARALNISYLDLVPALLASKKRTYHRRGFHLNSHGHLVVANALEKYLETVQAISFDTPEP